MNKSIEEQLKAIKKIVHEAPKRRITLRGKSMSLSCIKDTTLSFGKYRSENLSFIAENDPNYLKWLLTYEGCSDSLEWKLEAMLIALKKGWL